MNNKQRFSLPVLLLAAATTSNAGIIFNVTYDASVNAAQKGAFNYVFNEFSNLYSDNIHVNVNVNTMATGLGQSSTSLIGAYNYGQIKSYLLGDATSANDALANSNLSVTDPTAGGTFWLTRAQAKALQAISDDAVTSDGTISFNNTVAYTTDPLNRGVAGSYDLIGVAEHELSEVMGRISGLGGTIGSGPGYLPFDLYRYTATGTHNVTSTATGVYFSLNNGTTKLAGFNSGGGDKQDLDGAVATDPYNAATGTGQGHVLNPADLAALDVIGYNLVATPEPGTAVFVSTFVLVGFIVRCRRKGVPFKSQKA